MRSPVRSERDAFRQTMGAAAAILLAIVVGLIATPLAGAIVAAVALLAAAVAYLVAGRRDRPATLRAAATAPHPHGRRPGVRHVLVVANEPLSGPRLQERILADGPVELEILAPVLASRIHLGVTDVDRELADARRRLDRSLAWAQEQGLDAHGHVGDPSTTVALEDELRDFGADEVIVVTHPHATETRDERLELERLRGELDVRVSRVTAP